MKIKESRGDRVFNGFVNVILALCVFICAYPIYLVIINSFSDPDLVSAGKVMFIPVGFTIDAYKQAFTNGELMLGYRNTLYYTVVGVAINMLLTIPCAYALSKKKIYGNSFIMKMFVFTMYFGGGLIPHFMLLRALGLLNTWWVVPINGAVSTSNLIIARSFFSSGVPRELEESAEIDGASVLQTFVKIVLPLSKAMISVIMLYYAVGRWNSFSSDLYYLPMAQEKYGLQMILRQLIILTTKTADLADSEMADYYMKIANQMKYAVIVIASVPLLILYPFLQKYFEKGVMLGSVKG